VKIVTSYLEKRVEDKKPYSIVVVAEGIPKPKGKSAASHIAEKIEANSGLEARKTILGYIQRGGSPSPADRILATRYGAKAVELIAEGNFGQMVSVKGNKLTSVPLKQVGGKLRLVPPDHSIINKARNMGVCFGDKKV